MSSGSIYLIRNLANGKVYVGQTTQSCLTRFQQHLKLLKSNDCQAISRAIRKYGVDNFSLEVLETDISADELDKREEFYIEKYDSIKSGYNLCPGGQQWRKKPSLTKEQDRLVSFLYSQGDSSRQIAAQMQVTHSSILLSLKRQGIQRRPRTCNLPDRTSKVDIQVLADMYLKKGMTQEYIAKQFNVNVRTIQRAIRRYSLKRI